MDLTNEDVADILALLDSLPYDEFDLQTPRFRLTLRRAPDGGWTQESQILADPPMAAGGGDAAGGGGGAPNGGEALADRDGEAGGGGGVSARESAAPGLDGSPDGRLVAVAAPLPGTFYRAPRPGAAPFVEVGDTVGEDTVVAIVETMKLMNSVPAGTRGRVAEIRLPNAEAVAQGATLMLIEPEPA